MKNVIDAHCDTAGAILTKKESLLQNTGHISLERMRKFDSYVQFFAAWISKSVPAPYQYAKEMLMNLKEEVKQHQDLIEIVTTHDEICSVMERKKCGAILALEDGRSLEGKIENLYRFYDMDVRAICLAWNDDNELTDGISSKRGYGLTEFGKEVVAEMNRLHMIVDVSHITEKGFYDVAEISRAPFMASHSNCKSLCGHRRNLTDEQIRLMIDKKCFIGINLYHLFLTDEGKSDMGTVIKHMNHILELGGEDVLGLGSDFDGMDQLPEGICYVDDYMNLFDEMRKNGYSDVLIDKITHKNMLNFIKRIEK